MEKDCLIMLEKNPHDVFHDQYLLTEEMKLIIQIICRLVNRVWETPTLRRESTCVGNVMLSDRHCSV